jgi:hypothetical protein
LVTLWGGLGDGEGEREGDLGEGLEEELLEGREKEDEGIAEGDCE